MVIYVAKRSRRRDVPGDALEVKRRAPSQGRMSDALGISHIRWHRFDAPDNKINAEPCGKVLKRMAADIERMIDSIIKMLERLGCHVCSKQRPYELSSRYLFGIQNNYGWDE